MARLIHGVKLIDAGGIEEQVIWEVPKSAKYPDGVRYRMAFIRHGEKRPAVLYDNHHPKGHHRHIGGQQSAYSFAGVERLLADFDRDVQEARWRH